MAMERFTPWLMVSVTMCALLSALALRPGTSSLPRAGSQLAVAGGTGSGGTTSTTAAGQPDTTSTTFSREDTGCSVIYSIYGAPEIGAVEIELDLLNGALGFWEDCASAVDGAIVGEMPGSRWRLESLDGAITEHEQALFDCDLLVHHSDSIPTLEDSEALINNLTAEATDGSPTDAPKICISRVTCGRYFGLDPDSLDSGSCGDASGDGRLSSTDALTVLSSAVGASQCKQRVCDVDGNGTVTATDAVRVLAASVGLPDTLSCIAPC
jgi:hypothetical protein